jgi:hypothetical protein
MSAPDLDVTEHAGRTFDVQRSEPAAAEKYPVRPLLSAVQAFAAEPFVPYPKAWRRGAILDQGQEGACVGHGVTGELLATPDRVNFAKAVHDPDVPTKSQDMAFWLYRQAQREDEWEGEAYSGTSVNAGMRVAQRLGYVQGWRWATSREDFRDSLIQLGPVVLAIPWFSGMYSAPGGLLRVSGTQVGWHCILANAWHPALSVNGSPKTEKFRLVNSWGTSWGAYGSAWIDADELYGRLIEPNNGEMVVPLGRSLHLPEVL